MPVIKSAKKSLRQSLRRKEQNLKQKRQLKGLLKKVNFLLAQKKTEEAGKMLPQAYKAIDKAAKNGLIKKNTAARKKSRLADAINSLSKKAPGTKSEASN